MYQYTILEIEGTSAKGNMASEKSEQLYLQMKQDITRMPPDTRLQSIRALMRSYCVSQLLIDRKEARNEWVKGRIRRLRRAARRFRHSCCSIRTVEGQLLVMSAIAWESASSQR